MSIDLSTLSVKEMAELRKTLDKAITKRAESEKAEVLAAAIAAAESVAAEKGYKLSDIGFPMPGKAPKSKGVAKYRNPNDASQTWTGKGRRPNWIIEAQNAGVDIETMAI